MKQLLAFRHIHFENLGAYHRYFENLEYQITYVDIGLTDLSQFDVLNYDLLAILGGPIAAYDDEAYPYLKDELCQIKARLKAKRPILGFCLGAQLIARAMGASVYPGKSAEIGWIPLTLTVDGYNSPVRYLDGELTNMLHWHGDTFDLPVGAVRLASTEQCLNQIFSVDNYCLAFQCHPEFSGKSVESWLIGHACELAKHNIDIAGLRGECIEYANALQTQGIKCIEDWIGGLNQ